jgi:hypothetical protein
MATGRKTVVVGQVIDPVVWGNPLWDQSVQTFTSAADRTAQFTGPKQGAVTWLEDLKRLEVFDGSNWKPLPGNSTSVANAALVLSTTEASAATLPLSIGTWDVIATGYFDWALSTVPRFFARLQGPGWTNLDEHQVTFGAVAGSASVTIQKPGLVLGAAGQVDVAAYFTGGGAGTASLKNVKLKATRIG